MSETSIAVKYSANTKKGPIYFHMTRNFSGPDDANLSPFLKVSAEAFLLFRDAVIGERESLIQSVLSIYLLTRSGSKSAFGRLF